MTTASEVREWARDALVSKDAYEVDRCEYYIRGGRDVFVTKKVRGSLDGVYVAFEQLEDGSMVAWHDHELYDLKNQAGKLARAIDKRKKFFDKRRMA